MSMSFPTSTRLRAIGACVELAERRRMSSDSSAMAAS
jgi:hypothetical protein